MRNYTVIYMKKTGEVIGKIDCHKEATVNHLVEIWKNNSEQGICLTIDHDKYAEKFYEK